MSNDTINFSHKYSKLKDKQHNTIRTHEKWKVGYTYPETVNRKFLQYVLVVDRVRAKLTDMNPAILLRDTDSISMPEVYDKFNLIKQGVCLMAKIPFVPYDFSKQIFTLYFLRIVKDRKGNIMKFGG